MATLSKPHPTVVTRPLPADPGPLNVVETPTSPSSAFALSRFEFEADKGNEGTKILMVEWDSSVAAGKDGAGKQDLNDWEVEWEGKAHVLPIRDSDAEIRGMKRVFFLLPPGAHVPALVNISQRSGGIVLRTKPMPAIFPAELGAGNKDVGKRGVLHSIWAKKRLSELEAEIKAEMKTNSESIGLEMAIQERDWIADHFGVGEPAGARRAVFPQSPAALASPRSPIGGRLGEKLKGLKLATSPADLAAATHANKSRPKTSFTPKTADVAFSSYATFQGRTPPKSSIEPTVASLDALVDGDHPRNANEDAPDTEEELFALPLSPRSPDMQKSPFSLL